jgi:hypothetical protein
LQEYKWRILIYRIWFIIISYLQVNVYSSTA